ncbi:hypothetical protein [Natrinema marinum]|uniref:hypothetical protein n=1 Tax=Natrinema marinum TaxID=2961598 RepID=UPI0020C8E1CF|nr:hypothetical protein [Natrinema marinum]
MLCAVRFRVQRSLPAETIVESTRTAPMPVATTRYLANEYGVPTDEMVARLAELAADGVWRRTKSRVAVASGGFRSRPTTRTASLCLRRR